MIIFLINIRDFFGTDNSKFRNGKKEVEMPLVELPTKRIMDYEQHRLANQPCETNKDLPTMV